LDLELEVKRLYWWRDVSWDGWFRGHPFVYRKVGWSNVLKRNLWIFIWSCWNGSQVWIGGRSLLHWCYNGRSECFTMEIFETI